MPVERRLRGGFQRNADVMDPDVDRFLVTVVRRGRRRVLRHRATAGVAVVAVIVGAVVAGPHVLDVLRREVPAKYPSPTPQVSGLTPQSAVVVGLDGTVQSTVSGLPPFAYAFSLSSDGTKIAFVTNQGGTNRIGTIGIDGSGLTILSHVPFPAGMPAWSPDGARIAFQGTSDGGNADIYVMNADGSNVRPLTSDPNVDEWPAWSPDGSRILYDNSGATPLDESGFSRTSEIYTVPASGGTPIRLTDNDLVDSQAVYSPDGTQIAVHRQGDTWIMDANGGNARILYLRNCDCWGLTPQWSPDGSRIALTTYDPSRRATVQIQGGVSDEPIVTVHIVDLKTGDLSDVVGVQMAAGLNTPQWLPSGDALLINNLEGP